MRHRGISWINHQMQCFGGCFAAQKEPAVNYGKSAVLEADVTAGSGKWAFPASGKGQVSTADISVDCRSSAPAPSTSSNSLLRLLSSKSSKKLEGPTYTPTEDTSDYERDLLRQQYTMQHGRHILGVSTLQQEQLHHFVMPGQWFAVDVVLHLIRAMHKCQQLQAPRHPVGQLTVLSVPSPACPVPNLLPAPHCNGKIGCQC